MSLADLLKEVKDEADRIGDRVNYSNVLVSVLRRYKFWPALQVKKFFDGSMLTLLHNTYKRIDVDHFQSLYDECRSVVLDLSAPEGENVVVTFTQSIPQRMTLGQYAVSMETTDVCTLSYEGTVITAYHHNDKWHFGTSTCPTVDSSKYFHPTKTHGMMLNEAIAKVLGVETPYDNGDIRALFAERLDKSKAYAFLLVHHENKHIIDYTQQFGESYAELLHINTLDRATLDSTRTTIDGVKTPLSFESTDAAVAYIEQNADTAYGIFVVRADGSLLKVSSDKIVRREELDLGNSNMWQNMLHVYMLQLPDYKINDYINEYVMTDYLAQYNDGVIAPHVSSKGTRLGPTYIIHSTMVALCNILYGAYRASTYYSMKTQRYKVIKHVDDTLESILKFHMAQLRNLQISHHTHKPLNTSAIMGYLCHHNTMKNMRLLIEHVASSPSYMLEFEAMECVRVLNNKLNN